MASAFLEDSDRFNLIEVIEGLKDCILAEEYPPLNEVRKENFGLVSNML